MRNLLAIAAVSALLATGAMTSNRAEATTMSPSAGLRLANEAIDPAEAVTYRYGYYRRPYYRPRFYGYRYRPFARHYYRPYYSYGYYRPFRRHFRHYRY
jgi:hypothetical protein